MDPAGMTTRDPNLPAEYSAGLDLLSLAPLWTALHALLPQERVHVIEGRGESRIGDEAFTWEQGDCVAVPPWRWVQHQNPSASAPACLFHFNDEPALRALGLWMEETR